MRVDVAHVYCTVPCMIMTQVDSFKSLSCGARSSLAAPPEDIRVDQGTSPRPHESIEYSRENEHAT